jgi:hypothetical protein
VEQKHPEQDWTLLTDRLYRRYVQLDKLQMTSLLMDQVRSVFVGLPSDAISWEGMAASTRRDRDNKTLAGLFEKYFESFAQCVESARMNNEVFKSCPDYEYEAVRLVLADQPWFLVDKNRPLEDYDALEGLPFWSNARHQAIDSAGAGD